MAITAEQQAQSRFSTTLPSAVDRRMEAVRLARDILMENDRNKPTGERGITASDVTAFADTLLTYVTQ
jgi:hypothetical protein